MGKLNNEHAQQVTNIKFPSFIVAEQIRMQMNGSVIFKAGCKKQEYRAKIKLN